ncbi:hypothetical protein MLD38_026852 [Melastoma candidum]|uniref:Uncharacterized protein n=1 Tax=Melastoma candidum TaxID=119954 RepID=A0ACB9P1F1_9MYRT|nr:hypothetical protein MLD38_026852 [Melastoma candidum]
MDVLRIFILVIYLHRLWKEDKELEAEKLQQKMNERGYRLDTVTCNIVIHGLPKNLLPFLESIFENTEAYTEGMRPEQHYMFAAKANLKQPPLSSVELETIGSTTTYNRRRNSRVFRRGRVLSQMRSRTVLDPEHGIHSNSFWPWKLL